MRPQPLISVHNVEASSRWYQKLFGCQSAHGGPNHYECWLRDLDGYTAVIASPDDTAT